MSGLIYRELYLTRKDYISAFLAYLLIMLLCVLVNLSLSFGNLRDIVRGENEEMTRTAIFHISVLVPSMILYTVSAANMDVTDKDMGGKWLTFQSTIPVSTKKCALAKTVIIAVSVIFAFIMSFINLAVFCALYGKSPDKTLIGLLMLLPPVTTLGTVALISLTLLFRNSTAAVIFMIAAFIALLYFLFLRQVIVMDNEPDIKLLMSYLDRISGLTWLYLPLTAAVLAAGQMIFTALLKRRA